MPELNLLPLGSVVRLKGMLPGWEKLRFMITSYYPLEIGGPRSNDYTITPWPLGFLNFDDGTQEAFLSCNEDGIETVEFLGAVDELSREKTDRYYREALSSDEVSCPLAKGVEPMMHAYGDLPCTIGDIPFFEDDILPLGTVISTKANGSRKAMIYQHSGSANGERYGYGICAWPEGADPGDENIVLIKHDEITAVHFRGYENALSQEVAKILEKKRRGSLLSRIFRKL